MKTDRLYLGAAVKVNGMNTGKIVRNIGGGHFIVKMDKEKTFKQLPKRCLEVVK